MRIAGYATWSLVSLLVVTAAQAQAPAPSAAAFPNRPVRIVVPGSVGTGMDNMGRSLAQALTETYKQQVIIDNRAGAGSLIGTGIVAAAAPDGYTLGIGSTGSFCPGLGSSLSSATFRDFDV